MAPILCLHTTVPGKGRNGTERNGTRNEERNEEQGTRLKRGTRNEVSGVAISPRGARLIGILTTVSGVAFSPRRAGEERGFLVWRLAPGEQERSEGTNNQKEYEYEARRM